MPFLSAGSIKYYQFNTLDVQGIFHAVFTRQGGVSPAPWSSLNFGSSVGDDKRRVLHNRELALRALNLAPESVFDLYQIHSTNIVITNRPLALGEGHQKADAILTSQPNVTLMMRFADCTPILVYDPVKRVIGIAHAGWIGTVEQIAKKMVFSMIEEYGTNPNDLIAAIGPSIGPDHYSVGKEVIDRVYTSLGDRADQLILNRNGKSYFDLWKANQFLLMDIGVTRIEVSGICTCCNLEDWYSHRGEQGKTGRFGIVFGLSQ